MNVNNFRWNMNTAQVYGPKRKLPGYDTKLHILLKEYETLLFYHYSPVDCPGMIVTVKAHQAVKYVGR